MNKYIFKTSATMKEYNNQKWWIDSGIVRDITIHAATVSEALEQYREQVKEKYYIEISKNALKTKNNMYVDDENGVAVQVGYVITGKTEFEKENYGGWCSQYIDLWVTILTVVDTDF